MRQYDATHFDAADVNPSPADERGAAEALVERELELAESRRQFESLVGSLAGIFYRCPLAPPWKMILVTGAVEALTGYRPEEIEAMSGWDDIVLPNDLGATAKQIDRAVAERRSFSLSYRIIHKSGEERWVSEQGHAVYDASGTALFLEGVITDISGRKQAEEMQRTLMARWRKTLDSIPQMVWTMAPDGSDEFFNEQWIEFTGQRVGQAFGLPRSELVHPDDKEAALALWEKALAKGADYEAQYRMRHVSGEYRWVLSRGHPEKDPRGEIIRWYGTCTDVHERVVAQEQLITQQEFVQRLISACPDGLILLDANGCILFANDIARNGLWLPSDAIAGEAWVSLLPPKAQRDARRVFASALATGRRAQFTVSLPGSETRWWDVIVTPVSEAGEARLLVTSRDITHQKQAENQAKWSASHDILTQLPNRAVFQKRLQTLVGGNRREPQPFTLLLFDIDDFKRTNDTLGHDAGDALLCAFADRLRRVMRPEDLAARLGGDEFALLVTGIDNSDDLEPITDRLMDALREPCIHDGKLLECRASIGGSFHPHHGGTGSDLLKHADLALYVAKGSGRGTLRIFEPGMRLETQRRNSMISLAKKALGEDLIVPHYQPKVELGSGRIAGFEALLRWYHARHGLQAPDTIKAAFEDLTVAAEISDRMIERVIIDARNWLDQGLDFGHVAINAAAAEFRRGDFAERLLERMANAGVPNHCIQLEVTETVFLGRGGEHVERALTTLDANGVRIALDDFGTGFASLSHLKQFPVHTLKIDRSFVRDLQIDGGDGAIVDAVIGLGKSLAIDVVAEGVETRAQHDTLVALGCRYGQGFLYGKAEPAELAAAMIGREKPVRRRAS